MSPVAPSSDASPPNLRPTLGWRRLRATLVASALLGILLSLGYQISALTVVARALVAGVCAMLAFSLFERWPAQLPR